MSSDTPENTFHEDVTTNDDKYTVQLFDSGRHKALRYGKPWPAYEGVQLSNLEVELARDLLETRKQLDVMRYAEQSVSSAYVKLRTMIPGALDTPIVPNPEQIQTITEAALQKLLDRQIPSSKIAEDLTADFIRGERDAALKRMTHRLAPVLREDWISYMEEFLNLLPDPITSMTDIHVTLLKMKSKKP